MIRNGRVGQRVRIGRFVRRLVASYGSAIPGGWRVDRPVDGFVSWNVDAMRAYRRRRR